MKKLILTFLCACIYSTNAASIPPGLIIDDTLPIDDGGENLPIIPMTCDAVGSSCTNCIINSFVCDTASGYYGTAKCTGTDFSTCAGCAKCPANATCASGKIVCNAGYYLAGTACLSCQDAFNNSAATSAAGATAITGCYLPASTTGTDSNGNSFSVEERDCYYKSY